MKFNIAYVRQNPVMFGAIFIVFGLFLWLLLNRNASVGGTTVVSSGPSDATVAAGMQLQLASIAAGSEAQKAQLGYAAMAYQTDSAERIATLEASYQLAELQANTDMSDKTLEASLAALGIQSQNTLDITTANNQFMVDYARVAYDASTTQTAISAALQRSMSADQLEAFKYGVDASKYTATLGAIGSLKKKDRDNALAGIVGYTIPNDPTRSGGGGFNLGDVLHIISPVTGLLQ